MRRVWPEKVEVNSLIIDPTIQCPADITIECSEDYNDLNITGSAVGYDNCSVESVTNQLIQVNVDDCGVGFVRRRFTVTDAGGRTASCIQRIDLVNSNVFNGNNPNMLSFPNDVQLEGCMNDNTDE